jgi:hypothetical protein
VETVARKFRDVYPGLMALLQNLESDLRNRETGAPAATQSAASRYLECAHRGVGSSAAGRTRTGKRAGRPAPGDPAVLLAGEHAALSLPVKQ